MTNYTRKFLDFSEAEGLDLDLTNHTVGYKIEQLMEIAGFNCASCILYCLNNSLIGNKAIKSIKDSSIDNPIAIFCGPGNNGGDGLVIARFLKLFGGFPIIIYPKKGKHSFITNLLYLIDAFKIPCYEKLSDVPNISNSILFVDAIFGFGFNPNNDIKGPFDEILKFIINSSRVNKIPTISIDVPSGWSMSTQNTNKKELLAPDVLISIIAPKSCSKYYNGLHFIASSLVPIDISKKYGIDYINKMFIDKSATQFVLFT